MDEHLQLKLLLVQSGLYSNIGTKYKQGHHVRE